MPRYRAATLASVAAALGTTVLVLVSSVSATAQGVSPSTVPKWHQLFPSPAPPSRDRPGFAYDRADKYAVLYGGFDYYFSGTFYYDTWTYSGGVWKALAPITHPSAPTGLVLAYDPVLNGVLEFGGESPYGGKYYNETWLFKAGNWTQLHPVGSPPARSQYSMAYDVADSEMVLFGGVDGGSVPYLSDTWVFNGSNWTQVHSAKSPPGRQQAQMVYDAGLRQVLLFGGSNVSLGQMVGTWAFSAGKWNFLPGTNAPVRDYPEATVLPNGTPIEFGGQTTTYTVSLHNSTFEFFAGGWHRVHFRNTPPVRGIGGMTFDAQSGYDVLFGGINTVYTYLNDTWTLR